MHVAILFLLAPFRGFSYCSSQFEVSFVAKILQAKGSPRTTRIKRRADISGRTHLIRKENWMKLTGEETLLPKARGQPSTRVVVDFEIPPPRRSWQRWILYHVRNHCHSQCHRQWRSLSMTTLRDRFSSSNGENRRGVLSLASNFPKKNCCVGVEMMAFHFSVCKIFGGLHHVHTGSCSRFYSCKRQCQVDV